MKRLLATAIAVALVAPAMAEQRLTDEQFLAKIIAPGQVAELSASLVTYRLMCADVTPRVQSFMEALSFIADRDLVRAAVARLPAQVAEIGGRNAWCRTFDVEVRKIEDPERAVRRWD